MWSGTRVGKLRNSLFPSCSSRAWSVGGSKREAVYSEQWCTGCREWLVPPRIPFLSLHCGGALRWDGSAAPLPADWRVWDCGRRGAVQAPKMHPSRPSAKGEHPNAYTKYRNVSYAKFCRWRDEGNTPYTIGRTSSAARVHKGAGRPGTFVLWAGRGLQGPWRSRGLGFWGSRETPQQCATTAMSAMSAGSAWPAQQAGLAPQARRIRP
eukprot:gene1797-biopygen9414